MAFLIKDIAGYAKYSFISDQLISVFSYITNQSNGFVPNIYFLYASLQIWNEQGITTNTYIYIYIYIKVVRANFLWVLNFGQVGGPNKIFKTTL